MGYELTKIGHKTETASFTILDPDNIFKSYELSHHYRTEIIDGQLTCQYYDGTTMFFDLNDNVLLSSTYAVSGYSFYVNYIEGDHPDNTSINYFHAIQPSLIDSPNSPQYQVDLNGGTPLYKNNVDYINHYVHDDGKIEDVPIKFDSGEIATLTFHGRQIKPLSQSSPACINGIMNSLTSFNLGIFLNENANWKKNQWVTAKFKNGTINGSTVSIDFLYPYFQNYRRSIKLSTNSINDFECMIDNAYKFIYGINRTQYFVCDVSGNILSNRINYNNSYTSQLLYENFDISCNNLSGISYDDPVVEYASNINKGYYNNEGSSTSSINDEYPEVAYNIENYSMCYISAYDESSLKNTLSKIELSASNHIFLGYVGISNPKYNFENTALCNVIDGTTYNNSKIMFIPMKPLTTTEKTSNDDVDKFWPANVMLYPVFINNTHAILNLIGSTDKFILNDYNAFKDSFQNNLVSAYNNIVVENFDVRSQTKEDFINKVKNSVRYDTLFMYVFSHGYHDLFKGEGTALQNVVGLEEGIKSSTMYKFLTSSAKNIVFQSIACFGAGTIRPDYEPHDFPDVFPPKETLSGKNGKSIMYIVGDVANSPAWCVNDKSFSSRFIPLYFNNGYTYEQVVQHFNETIKATKTSIFKTLKKMYKSMMTENCLLACMDDYNGNKIPVFKDYPKFLSENYLVVADLNRFGLKYIVEDKERKKFNTQLAFFKILLGIINENRLLISLYFDSLDDMLESSSSVFQLNTKEAKKAYAAWYKELVTPINVPNMIENTSPMTNFIGDDYDEYINNRDTIQEVYVRNMYKFLYDVIKQSQFIMYDKDMPGYSKTYLKIHKVRDNAIKTYLNATSNFTKLLISGMYEIYSNALNYLNNRYPAMKIKDMYCGEIYTMICRNFIEDYPCAGFLKATPEFKAKEFMT